MARRVDPRVEPTSMPPKESADERAVATDVVVVPKNVAEPPREAAEEEPPSSGKGSVTNVDPRVLAVEESLAAGDWSRIAKDLGTVSDAARLPPNLGLLCALAHAESEADAPGASALAIQCMAAIYGIPADSRLALVLAKRLLRKNPVAWSQRRAPPARISLLIIFITLVLGAAVGWLLTSGIVKIRLPG
jgi:hypothetical protein